ncbi:MAG TPA: mechanosensitive ion channel family protein [Burkholderiaceae bacterium]|nr:mechanosensitive ion channel family protein [Burkholderiaceae bacterium]HQZ06621.1 mechanosensitive ion channel family protein [Burkholderiaceae bacterium]HRA61187.1 mechanosensitive ion channel family protein [Burkholderiaceae bacterium]
MHFLRLFTLVVGMALASVSALAQAATEPAPEKVRALLQILADPQVQRWIEQQRSAPAAAGASQVAAADKAAMASQIDGIRAHLASIQAAVPKVAGAMAEVFARVHAEMAAYGMGSVFLLVAAFAALGFGCERLFWLASGSVRQRIMASAMDTPVERLRTMLMRFGFGSSWVAAFAVGTIGAFLVFDWPPVLRDLLLRLLVAVVMVRLSLVVGRLLFAPGAERFRMLPMDTAAAWFWHRRLVANMVGIALQFALIEWLIVQGVDPGVVRVVAYGLYLAQMVLIMEMVWRRPGPRDEHYKAVGWVLSVALFVLLLLRVIGAFPLFWTGALLLGVYGIVRLLSAITTHLQRTPGAPLDEPVVPSIGGAAFVRAIRVLLIIAAALVLARNLGIDPVQVMTGESAAIRILRGALSVVVIALFADLVWFVFKAMLERKLAQAQAVGPDDTTHAGQATRLRTVLPILRNVSFVTLALIAVLTAMSALGIDIAPMVAGAGVLGIAVGFGAQTLVKDIVSGVFFLFDDAFRVGEYIQSGNYKGTVESFSLRSVRLRHHRGPVYTVPFGELGAVQNMSRDWVIDKLSIGITYDSNLEMARKLIKKIGQDLAADTEMGPNILEPLKMQGVEQFGDFAIQIRMKMMTRPGEQFVIRRKAYAAIKTAFDANGIRFAFPTVQVAGGAESSVAAAAQQMLAGSKPAPAN